MTERERLIKLIEQCSCHYSPPCTGECCECHNVEMYDRNIEHIADHLLANGVIVPPCKVGDTVYILDVIVDSCKCADCDYYYAGGMGDLPECEKTSLGYRYHKCVEIIEQRAIMQSILAWLICNDFGKTVFLTREEAEKTLEERSET